MKTYIPNFFAIAMFLLMGTCIMAQTQYEVTFTIDMTEADPFNPDTEDVYITGTFANWSQPGTDLNYKLEPINTGSMLYTLTTTIDSGEIQYKYFRIIDNTPSWDDGEWAGDPNRKVYLTNYITIDNVWANMPYDVTFNVDMTDATPFNPDTDDVYIAGSLANGWAQPGTISAYMMVPSDSDTNIYTITLLLYENDYLYKYFRIIDNTPSWDNGEWDGDPNREVTVVTTAIIDNIWGITTGIFTEHTGFAYGMYPNPVITTLNISNISDVNQIDIFDVMGKLVRTVQVEMAQSVTIDVAELQTGIYIVNVTNNKGTQTSKFIKN